MKNYKVTGIYYTGEETCEETFDEYDCAKDYFETLIEELREEYEDVKESIDYVAIYETDEEGNYQGRPVDCYTYD